MDLRVLVLIAERELGTLVRAQVENLGCRCHLAESYDDATGMIEWADAAIVDLVGDGLDDLNRLRVEAPKIRTLAIVPDGSLEDAARSAGADGVLTEPFSVADLVAGVRAMGSRVDPQVIDVRDRQPAEVEDAPWWATR